MKYLFGIDIKIMMRYLLFVSKYLTPNHSVKISIPSRSISLFKVSFMFLCSLITSTLQPRSFSKKCFNCILCIMLGFITTHTSMSLFSVCSSLATEPNNLNEVTPNCDLITSENDLIIDMYSLLVPMSYYNKAKIKKFWKTMMFYNDILKIILYCHFYKIKIIPKVR